MVSRRPAKTAPILRHLRPTGANQAAVLDELRRVLVAGGAPPGTALPLDEIASVFGISRIPVREALRMLQAEGLVEHLPRGGYTVALLSWAEHVELNAARAALERTALAAAVEHADANVDTQLRTIQARGAAALEAGDTDTWDRVSRDIHAALLAPCGMRRLLHLWEEATNVSGLARPMTRLPASRLRALHAEHEAIVTAYLTRDAPLVIATNETHMEHVEDALASLDEQPDS